MGRCCAPVLVAARTCICSSVRAETEKCNNFQEPGGVLWLFCYFLKNHLLVSLSLSNLPSPSSPPSWGVLRWALQAAWGLAACTQSTAFGNEGDTAGISKFLQSCFLWLSLNKYEVQWIWIRVRTGVGLLWFVNASVASSLPQAMY